MPLQKYLIKINTCVNVPMLYSELSISKSRCEKCNTSVFASTCHCCRRRVGFVDNDVSDSKRKRRHPVSNSLFRCNIEFNELIISNQSAARMSFG